ncbi:MAG TPA: LuxR C-terminal-related transcriptional regulator [Myxococcales bacterium]|jgi:DNA-binding NarL/FixJ family response regulator|nr:LuxR C-terminal-related transcriptional regulator [Myxococcales bacterium]
MSDRGTELGSRAPALAAAAPARPPESGRGFSALTTHYGLAEGVAHVVALACQGLECKEIAGALGLSESTIKKKLTLASRRLNARGRGHLCALSGMLACGVALEEAQALLRGTAGAVRR